MSKAQTSPTVEAEIVTAYNSGLSLGAIEARTGIPKSTVRNVVKRAKKDGRIPDDGAPNGTDPEPAETHARDREEPVPNGTTNGTGNGTAGTQKARHELTEQRAIDEIYTYLNVAKRGYNDACTVKDPHERVWEQTQFLKHYHFAIEMLIRCTGLDDAKPAVNRTSPINDYMEDLRKLMEADR